MLFNFADLRVISFEKMKGLKHEKMKTGFQIFNL
jgi:hypothetical protein